MLAFWSYVGYVDRRARVPVVDDALPMPRNVSRGGGLLALIAQKLAKVWSHPPSLSVKDRALVCELESAAAFVGSQLLAATSLDDLVRRIDDVLGSRQTAALLNRLVQAAQQLDLGAALTEPPSIALDFVDVLGEGQRSLLNEAHQLLGAIYDACEKILDEYHRLALAAAVVGVHVELPSFDEDDPLSFQTNPDIPPEIASAVFGNMVATVLLLAIVDAHDKGTRLEPWLARALTERLVDGLRKYVRLLASVAMFEVSPSVIPLEDRLDLKQIERENDEYKRIVEQFHLDADASGEDVYAPEPPG